MVEDIKYEPNPVAWMYNGRDWRGSEICYLYDAKQSKTSWSLSRLYGLRETPLYDHKPVHFTDTALYAQRMETQRYQAMLYTAFRTISEQAKGLRRLSNKVKNLTTKYRVNNKPLPKTVFGNSLLRGTSENNNNE